MIINMIEFMCNERSGSYMRTACLMAREQHNFALCKWSILSSPNGEEGHQNNRINVTYTHHTDASTLYSDEGRGQLR